MNEIIKSEKPKKIKPKKSDECIELKNIKYQTMLINNTNIQKRVVNRNTPNIHLNLLVYFVLYPYIKTVTIKEIIAAITI